MTIGELKARIAEMDDNMEIYIMGSLTITGIENYHDNVLAIRKAKPKRVMKYKDLTLVQSRPQKDEKNSKIALILE